MDESVFRRTREEMTPQACAEKFGGLANLPYSTMVQSVVAYQIRRRRQER